MRREIQRFVAAGVVACAALVLFLSSAVPVVAASDVMALGPTNPGCASTSSSTTCIWSDGTTDYVALNKFCSQAGYGCQTCVQHPDTYCGLSGYAHAF